MDQINSESKGPVMNNVLLEAERARRAMATLGVVVTGIKDLDRLKTEIGDDGIAEVQEQFLERIRANVRRVDLVTALDNYTIAVISVDRNPHGPKVLARKVYDLLSQGGYLRMGRPVEVVVAVGGTSGQPRDENTLETFINTAKDALVHAMNQTEGLEFRE
jgi:PleD family two-component response regulator